MSGSGQTDVSAWLPDVRYTPKSGHQATIAACPLCADCVEKLGVEADRDR
jgi:hypothetical protein